MALAGRASSRKPKHDMIPGFSRDQVRLLSSGEADRAGAVPVAQIPVSLSSLRLQISYFEASALPSPSGHRVEQGDDGGNGKEST